MLSIGEILKKQRENKNLTLLDIQKHTKIREKLLEAVERNDWKIFSSKVYIAGIVKNYAEFLGLDSKKALAFFRRDYERQEEVKFKIRVASKYLVSETKKIATYGIILVIGVFLIYFGYQFKIYLSPPKVTFISPKQERFTKEDRIKIVAQTEKDAVVTIFGERIYQNKDGIFDYDMLLKSGKNEVQIEVTGANGKKTTVKKYFYK